MVLREKHLIENTERRKQDPQKNTESYDQGMVKCSDIPRRHLKGFKRVVSSVAAAAVVTVVCCCCYYSKTACQVLGQI